MIDDLVLRLAQRSDIEALYEVHTESVRNLCASAYSKLQLVAWFEGRTPEIYLPAIAAQQIWLLAWKHRVLGFVGFEPGEITLLFVRKEAAGLGLGKRLFEHGLVLAQRGHSGPITVIATSNARGFYESYGFSQTEAETITRGQSAVEISVVKMQRK